MTLFKNLKSFRVVTRPGVQFYEVDEWVEETFEYGAAWYCDTVHTDKGTYYEYAFDNKKDRTLFTLKWG